MRKMNPFFHRGPIRDATFFHGRQSEVGQSLALLYSNQSVSLVGPRRMGKTSLLLYLLDPGVQRAHGFTFERTCFVYLNCEGWGRLKPGALYALFLEELGDALAANGYQTEFSAGAEGITYRAFERAVRTLVHQQIRIVFLLDEFEALSANPHLDADFFSGLRGLSSRHGVAYLTASTEPLLALTYAQSSTLSSPFFNFFVQLRIGLFPQAEAVELMTSLADMGGKTFSVSTLDCLLSLAGPHPLLLQVAGYHAFEHAMTTGAPLGETDCAQVQRRFLLEAEPHWTYYWHNLSPADQRFLALLPVTWPSDLEAAQRLDQAVCLSPAFREFVGRQPVDGLLQAPPVTLDLAQRIALSRGRSLSVAPTEFNLLACLATSPAPAPVRPPGAAVPRTRGGAPCERRGCRKGDRSWLQDELAALLLA